MNYEAVEPLIIVGSPVISPKAPRKLLKYKVLFS